MISRRRYHIPMKIVRRKIRSDNHHYKNINLYSESFQSYIVRKEMEKKDSNLSIFGIFLTDLFNGLNYNRMEKK